jgi:hypothetical protein
MLSPFDLPDGIVLLITDELASPADFILYQSVISRIKESTETKASKTTGKNIILSGSPAQGLSKWQAVAAKSVSSPS